MVAAIYTTLCTNTARTSLVWYLLFIVLFIIIIIVVVPAMNIWYSIARHCMISIFVTL